MLLRKMPKGLQNKNLNRKKNAVPRRTYDFERRFLFFESDHKATEEPGTLCCLATSFFGHETLILQVKRLRESLEQ